MKIIIFATEEDREYAQAYNRLAAFSGHSASVTFKDIDNIALAERICDKYDADAGIIARKGLLESALINHSDYIPPLTRKQITLDDYAGSLLHVSRSDKPSRPYLVVNPFQRIFTVPYEKFVVDRYISKLTRPSKWFQQTAFKYQELTADDPDLERIAARLEQARLIGIDCETFQSDSKPISCISWTGWFAGSNSTETYAIPFTTERAWRFAKRVNANPVPKVFQRGIYDHAYFLRWGIPTYNWLHDTLNFFHCLYSELPKDLAFITAFAIRDIRYWKDDGKTGGISALLRYCGKDSWATVNSYLSLLQDAPAYAFNNYALHEFPMVFPAIHAALEGVRIDPKEYERVKERTAKDSEKDLSRIRRILRSPGFNPRSWQQLQKLIGVLIFMPSYKGGTGKIEIAKIKHTGVFNEWLLSLVTDYKESAKRTSDFFHDRLIWSGRMLFEIDPAGTDTGRTASKASQFWCGHSIQTIPPAIKPVIVSDPGWLLAEIDKKQSEARCVGYLSGETKLIELVESTHDYHSWNAAEFFGLPYESIYDEARGKVLNKPIRNTSKRTNHGANYNMTAPVLLDTMGPKSVSEAKILLRLPKNWSLMDVCTYLLNRYDETYPRVRGDYYNDIINRITTSRRLVSPLGWTRIFHGDPSRNKPQLNAAVAHEPQNLSVSIVNREWYKVWHSTVYGELRDRVRIIGQIHDSLFFQYREGDYEAVKTVARMMNTRVPITDQWGTTRVLYIPSDISPPEDSQSNRWSEIKD